MSAPTLKPMSVDEYLRTEEASPVKREHAGGFTYQLHGSTEADAGTTAGHNLIGLNMVVALHQAAWLADCQLYAFNFRLHISQTQSFYYPDLLLTHAGTRPGPQDTYATDPCLLVEIVSEESEERDRLAKYAAYTQIACLHTYLIVKQAERRVYAYQRHGGEWRLEELASSGSVNLPCLSHTLTLDDIYADFSI